MSILSSSVSKKRAHEEDDSLPSKVNVANSDRQKIEAAPLSSSSTTSSFIPKRNRVYEGVTASTSQTLPARAVAVSSVAQPDLLYPGVETHIYGFLCDALNSYRSRPPLPTHRGAILTTPSLEEFAAIFEKDYFLNQKDYSNIRKQPADLKLYTYLLHVIQALDLKDLDRTDPGAMREMLQDFTFDDRDYEQERLHHIATLFCDYRIFKNQLDKVSSGQANDDDDNDDNECTDLAGLFKSLSLTQDDVSTSELDEYEPNLQRMEFKTLPPLIRVLKGLETLELLGKGLTGLPDEVFQLTQMTMLQLDDNYLGHIDPQLGNLAELTYLGLGSTDLTVFPDCISKLTKLEDLYLGGNSITEAPNFDLRVLKNLKELYIGGSELKGKFKTEEILEHPTLKLIEIDDKAILRAFYPNDEISSDSENEGSEGSYASGSDHDNDFQEDK